MNKLYNDIDDESHNILTVQENESGKPNNIEQMQILTKSDKASYLSPIEQYKNYPNYHFFQKFGILFCKIGNTLTCNFDPNNNNAPKICIGPHWYLGIVANGLIAIFTSVMYFLILQKNTNTWQKFIYYILVFVIYYYFNKCALMNPGIVQNSKKDKDNSSYCNICHVYYNPSMKVEHCSMCEICVEKMDHHCIWVGKCVAKKNRDAFYLMILSILICYLYIVFVMIWQYATGKYKPRNKKIL